MPSPSPSIPDGDVLLHVGPFKTGTTTIQALLAQARKELPAHGVTYPGGRHNHHAEARAVLQQSMGWKGQATPSPPPERWRALVKRIDQLPGRIVVSSEYFSFADDAQVRQVADAIGGDRLHVVIAARNPGSIALSMWQQVLRDGRVEPLDDWLEDRFRRPVPATATRGFWSWSDAATLAERWSGVVDPERIRVIVISEQDRGLLPRSFEDLLALPAGFLSDRTAPRTNRSLTAPEAELLRQTVDLVRDRLTWDEFSVVLKNGFVPRLVDRRTPPPAEARSVLPTWAAEQAATEAEATAARLTASSVTIIGDLDDLRRVPTGAAQAPVDQVPVELAAEALAGVIEAASRRMRADAAGRAVTETAPATVAGVDDYSGRVLAAALWSRVRARLRPGRRSSTTPNDPTS